MSFPRQIGIKDINEYLLNPDLNAANKQLLEKITVAEIILQLSLSDECPDDYDYDTENVSIFSLLLKTLDRLITDSTHFVEILSNEETREILLSACKYGFDSVRVLISKKLKHALDFKDVNDDVHSIAWEMLFDPYFSVHNNIAKMLLGFIYSGNILLFTQKNVEYLINFVRSDANTLQDDYLYPEDVVNTKLRILDFVVDACIISNDLYKIFTDFDVFKYIFTFYQSNDILVTLNSLQIAEKYILSHLDIKCLNISPHEDCDVIKTFIADIKIHANEYLSSGYDIVLLPPLLEILTTISSRYSSLYILQYDDCYILKLISKILADSTSDTSNPVIYALIHSFYYLYQVPEFIPLLDNFKDIFHEMLYRLSSSNEQVQYETICTFIKLAENTVNKDELFDNLFIKCTGPYILKNFKSFALHNVRTRTYNLLELLIHPDKKSFNTLYEHFIRFFRDLDFKLQDLSYDATVAKESLIGKLIAINSLETLQVRFTQEEVEKLRIIISLP